MGMGTEDSEKTVYVAGFLLYRPATHLEADVLLVEKTRPDWQRGLLNAIGGRVEENEGLEAAQTREFREETSLSVTGWEKFCSETGLDYIVYFFRRTIVAHERPRIPERNDVGERLQWVPTQCVGSAECRCVGNLHWLLPMATDPRRIDAVVRTADRISDRPWWWRF